MENLGHFQAVTSKMFIETSWKIIEKAEKSLIFKFLLCNKVYRYKRVPYKFYQKTNFSTVVRKFNRKQLPPAGKQLQPRQYSSISTKGLVLEPRQHLLKNKGTQQSFLNET